MSDVRSNIVSLSAFKLKKQESEHGVKSSALHVSHKGANIGAHSESGVKGDFADRLQRIKQSLERINQLMSDLKKDR